MIGRGIAKRALEPIWERRAKGKVWDGVESVPTARRPRSSCLAAGPFTYIHLNPHKIT